MKILVLANQKGGVGKSAIATQLAHYCNRRGLSVLVIDLDHQQNTSDPLRANPVVAATPFSASDLFERPQSFTDQTGKFVLVPGDDRLSLLERQPDRHNQFAGNFRTAVRAARYFDICLIDTNPNPDIRYASALICADYVLAPIQLNQEAVNGIAGLLNHPKYGVARIKAALNPDLELLGLLPNLVEPTPFQRENLRKLITKFGARLIFDDIAGQRWFAHIPKRSSIAESQAAGVFLPDLEKSSAREAWRDIKPVFDAILKRMNLSVSTEVRI